MRPETLSDYFSRLGSRGGRKSRRVLEPSMARRMLRIREARRAYRKFHSRCFWSFDPALLIKEDDIPWVVDHLKRYGGRDAWLVADALCR